MAIDDLRNKGCILNDEPAGRGRSFIVTGMYRSGTSLVASILQHAGLLMGSAINDALVEDEEDLDNSGKTVCELRRGS